MVPQRLQWRVGWTRTLLAEIHKRAETDSVAVDDRNLSKVIDNLCCKSLFV